MRRFRLLCLKVEKDEMLKSTSGGKNFLQEIEMIMMSAVEIEICFC